MSLVADFRKTLRLSEFVDFFKGRVSDFHSKLGRKVLSQSEWARIGARII